MTSQWTSNYACMCMHTTCYACMIMQCSDQTTDGQVSICIHEEHVLATYKIALPLVQKKMQGLLGILHILLATCMCNLTTGCISMLANICEAKPSVCRLHFANLRLKVATIEGMVTR